MTLVTNRFGQRKEEGTKVKQDKDEEGDDEVLEVLQDIGKNLGGVVRTAVRMM